MALGSQISFLPVQWAGEWKLPASRSGPGCQVSTGEEGGQQPWGSWPAGRAGRREGGRACRAESGGAGAGPIVGRVWRSGRRAEVTLTRCWGTRRGEGRVTAHPRATSARGRPSHAAPAAGPGTPAGVHVWSPAPPGACGMGHAGAAAMKAARG